MRYPVLVLALFTLSFAWAQEMDLDKISDALSKGDAAALSQFFDRTVEVMVDGKGDVLTRDEARQKVSDFFAGNRAENFAVVHKGAAKGNASHYCIGDLKTAGKTYRVYLYMKTTPSSGGEYRIVELRFDS